MPEELIIILGKGGAILIITLLVLYMFAGRIKKGEDWYNQDI